MTEKYYTITEAARKLGLRRQSVHYLICHAWLGKCKPVRIDDDENKVLLWRIPTSLVDGYRSPHRSARQSAGREGASVNHKL